MNFVRWARVCCLCGLLGGLLMLTGDMLFYGAWTSGEAFHAYQEMASRPVIQLVVAGSLGPVAAILYAIGMGIFYVTLEPANRKLAAIAAFLLAITMLVGGAYHAVFTTFGFAAKVQDAGVRETLTSEIASLFSVLSGVTYATGIPGTVLVYTLAIARPTRFPRWLLLFLPTVLSLGSTVLRKWLVLIPAPFGGLVRGGWINGSFVLFFAVATVVFWNE